MLFVILLPCLPNFFKSHQDALDPSRLNKDTFTKAPGLSGWFGVDMRDFVQPNDPSVIKTLKEIKGNKGFLESDLEAIRNWVSTNFTYKEDLDLEHSTFLGNLINGAKNILRTFNPYDFFQYAEETIDEKEGDCEDFAILLCSLLRADGYSPKEVFVAFGTNEKEGHAFIIINRGGDCWAIEPRAEKKGYFDAYKYLLEGNEGKSQLWADTNWLSQYEIGYLFNDKYFWQRIPD